MVPSVSLFLSLEGYIFKFAKSISWSPISGLFRFNHQGSYTPLNLQVHAHIPITYRCSHNLFDTSSSCRELIILFLLSLISSLHRHIFFTCTIFSHLNSTLILSQDSISLILLYTHTITTHSTINPIWISISPSWSNYSFLLTEVKISIASTCIQFQYKQLYQNLDFTFISTKRISHSHQHSHKEL